MKGSSTRSKTAAPKQRKTAAAKKATRKKAVRKTASKKAVRKAPAKKATPRKKQSAAKKVAKKTTRKKKATKPTVKKIHATQDVHPVKISTVTLPTDASPRAVDKSNAIRATFFDHFNPVFQRIAYVSAFCFMLVGGSLIASDHFSSKPIVQFATDVCATGACVAQVAVVDTVAVEPSFSVSAPIPEVLTEEVRVPFVVSNGAEVDAVLKAVPDGGFIDLRVEELSAGKYRFTIPGNLTPGGYSARVTMQSLDGKAAYSFSAGKFQVPTASGELLTDETDLEAESVEDTVKPIRSEAPPDVFAIEMKESTLSAKEAIRVLVPAGYTNIQVYLRPINSVNPRFLGVPELNFDRYFFVFNTRNVPNGSYEIYATGDSAGQSKTSESKIVIVDNGSSIASSQAEQGSGLARDEIDISRSDAVIERALQSVEATRENFRPSVDFDQVVIEESDELLLEREDELNDLLKRFATAKQSKDEILITESEAQITDFKDKIVNKALSETRTRDIADDIDQALIEQLAEIKARVARFEEIRDARSNGKTSTDSDQDGISDFDEENLYGTDPQDPDTDGDGMLDGVEIIGGFDPLDPAIESIIRLESPRETIGLEFTDELSVESVTAFVQTDESLEVPEVQADITGRALPNSFVHVYVFSTPTVVTVKTDADGSFVYRFDKELEDGEHEVFVAFTDNTGSIIAQSEGFRFIKEARAFSPVDTPEAAIITSDPLPQLVQTQSFNLVVGLSILALGLILLMLGASLRGDSPKAEHPHHRP